MRTNFLSTNFLNTPRGPGHPGIIPGTSQIPLFKAQERQTFEGEHEVFDPHPFARKTPTPLGSLRTQQVNLCAPFSCLTGSGRGGAEVPVLFFMGVGILPKKGHTVGALRLQLAPARGTHQHTLESVGHEKQAQSFLAYT